MTFLVCLIYNIRLRVLLRLALMAEEEALARRFGELVKRLRYEQVLSQEDFSFRVGLHQTYVSSVERGKRNVTLGTADRIARALGTTLSTMISEIERDREESTGS